MILGMDLWVFTAWIGTMIVAIFCLLYGIYDWLIDESKEKKSKDKILSNKKQNK